MSPYDVTPDAEPLDVAAVRSDDAHIEALRRSLSPDAAVVWDDDDDQGDPAFALLRVLQREVAADLPAAAGLLPAGLTALVSRQRRFGRTATLAAVTAGVLSIGGVAAAATGSGSTLADVRHAVSSVVNAITPDHAVHPAVTKPRHSAKPSLQSSPHGVTASAEAGSAAAAAQIAAELDKAARFLAAGKSSAAEAQLDAAARKLPLVLSGTTRDAFAARITDLRDRLAGPHPEASDKGGQSADDAAKHDKGTADDGNAGGRADSTPGDSTPGDSSKDDSSKHDGAPPEKSSHDATTSERSKPESSRTPHGEPPGAQSANAPERAVNRDQAADPAVTTGE